MIYSVVGWWVFNGTRTNPEFPFPPHLVVFIPYTGVKFTCTSLHVRLVGVWNVCNDVCNSYQRGLGVPLLFSNWLSCGTGEICWVDGLPTGSFFPFSCISHTVSPKYIKGTIHICWTRTQNLHSCVHSYIMVHSIWNNIFAVRFCM